MPIPIIAWVALGVISYILLIKWKSAVRSESVDKIKKLMAEISTSNKAFLKEIKKDLEKGSFNKNVSKIIKEELKKMEELN